MKCRPLVVISSHTTKPIPPMIINEQITTFTTTSPAFCNGGFDLMGRLEPYSSLTYYADMA